MRSSPQPIRARFETRPGGYEQYLSSLSPGRGMVSISATCLVDESIVFGPDQRARATLDEHTIKLTEWLHGEYVAGRWRPKAASSAAFFVAIVEHYAGGRPRPEDRAVLMRKVLAHCMDIMKRCGRSNPLVPPGQIDPKRTKALDDLKKLQDDQEEQFP